LSIIGSIDLLVKFSVFYFDIVLDMMIYLKHAERERKKKELEIDFVGVFPSRNGIKFLPSRIGIIRADKEQLWRQQET